MKKFFLIPLMTLVCSVMAWADPVTTLGGLQDALNAGGEITLGADINAGATELAVDKDVILDLNGFTLSGAKSNDAAGVLRLTNGTLTVKATNGGGITATSKLNAIYVVGGTLNLTAGTFSGSYEGIMGVGGTINITGGTYTSSYDNAIWARGANLNISGGEFDGSWYDVQIDMNANATISGGTFAGDNDGTLAIGPWGKAGDISITGGTFNGTNGIKTWKNEIPEISGGTFAANPFAYVGEGYLIIYSDPMYEVISTDGVVAYNAIKAKAYDNLSGAVSAADAGDVLVMYANDNNAVEISKDLTIEYGSYSTNVSAGAGYVKIDKDQRVVITNNALATFLMGDEDEYTVDTDVDISSMQIIVKGNKTLTVNDGKKVRYQKRHEGSNILVPAGAKLTILGSGTFQPVGGTSIETSKNEAEQVGRHIIDVYGELVVGVKNDPNNQPHFITTSLVRSSEAIYVRKGANATFNNAHMQLGCVSIMNYGTTVIEGGEYISVSSASNGINNASWWSYNLQNYGKMTINGGHVQGVHGALACQNAYSRDQLENNGFEDVSYAVINGGLFETVYGTNFATGNANSADNFRALYVSNYAVVNIYGGEFKVKLPSACGQMALVDDNDAYNTFGIINLYGGKFQQKIKVGTREDVNSSYPSSIPVNSAWYSSFNTYAPLPAGYEYYDITEGEDYEAGYRYGVRAIPGADVAEVESNEPTIPWQQNTTWDADWTGGDDDVVPENNTIVTIPVGKTVVVDKDESETNAVAQQVFIAQDATLKVEDGTTLTVGEGGMNIGNGGKLIVEPGAIVKVGDAGIITTDNQALVIEATETDQAVLLYNPNVPVSENTQPKATVKLTTKSKMLNNSPYQYTYQRFALPLKAAATPENDFDPAIHEYYDATEESYGFESYIYYWNSHNWANCNWSALVPFKGYQLANNSKNGGVVYTFKGNLLGNEDGEYNFAEYGFDFFGNSYTAPINVETFLSGFGSDVEATIWLYNYGMSNWQQVSLEDFSDFGVAPEYQQIKSMDGFLLNLRAASGSANVNYNDAIWSNPLLGSSPSLAPARRVANSNLSNSAVITVTEANGHGDAVTLVEKATRSSEFENGADASKYMTEDGLSLYAETNAGQLSRVATNDLSNTVLTFRAGNETNYSLTIDKAQGEDYILRDNVTGNTIALANGATYNFTQAANTTVPARFEVIGIAKMPTAIDNVEAAAKASGIYTVTGQFLGHDFTNLPAGVYVVNGVKIVK